MGLCGYMWVYVSLYESMWVYVTSIIMGVKAAESMWVYVGICESM